MKNKKMIVGTILLLFAISGICNVVDVSAEEIEMPPLSWFSKGFAVDYKDELEIYVSSSKVINVYVMNQEQLDVLIDSNGLTWNYIKRWKDITYLEYTYIIQIEGVYHVVIYNKNLLYSRIVDYQITVNYYYEPFDPFDPDEPTENTFWDLLIFVVIPIVAIILVITIPIIIIRKYKKRTKEIVVIQGKEIPNVIYCPECGIKITDMTKDYCFQCGSKIIRK